MHRIVCHFPTMDESYGRSASSCLGNPATGALCPTDNMSLDKLKLQHDELSYGLYSGIYEHRLNLLCLARELKCYRPLQPEIADENRVFCGAGPTVIPSRF